jgi:hypothetical protein
LLLVVVQLVIHASEPAELAQRRRAEQRAGHDLFSGRGRATTLRDQRPERDPGRL